LSGINPAAFCAPTASGSEYAIAAYAIDAESSSALCFGTTKPEFMVAVFVIASTFLLLYGLRCCLVPVVGLECFFNCLEHCQVKTLCEKAKEILMEESNVQVRQISHTIIQLDLLFLVLQCLSLHCLS